MKIKDSLRPTGQGMEAAYGCVFQDCLETEVRVISNLKLKMSKLSPNPQVIRKDLNMPLSPMGKSLP